MIARVFPRRTKMSPEGEHVYFGAPPLWAQNYREIHISVCFTWDIEKGKDLLCQWEFYGNVRMGGPAFDDPGGEFEPGKYLKQGVTITSRGCPNNCPWCLVPCREGRLRELEIKPGRIVQDNNLLACSKSHVRKVFEMLRTQKQIQFAGGFEAWRVTDSVVEELRGLSIKQIWLAYDHPNNKKAVQSAVERLAKYFKRDKIRCYVLIGNENDTIDKAEGRLLWAWDIGALPFAMRYRRAAADFKGSFLFTGREWNLLARDWTRPAITKSMMDSLS